MSKGIKEKSFYLFAFGIYILMLKSLNAWFLWDISKETLELYTIISCLLFIQSNHIKFQITKEKLILFILVSCAILWNGARGLGLIKVLPWSFLFLTGLDDRYQIKLLNGWTNLYACILSVSLIAWGISPYGLLPNLGIIQYKDSIYYIYINYIFCLQPIALNADFFRFRSVFLEPGHTAMIAAFTVFANHYDFKKKSVIIIIICSLLTFSLAGYVLLIIGYTFTILQYKKIKNIIISFIPYIVLIIGVYSIAINYNRGENTLNNLIISRLEIDEEKGISGNNRTTEKTDETFDDFKKSSYLFTGLPRQTFHDAIEDTDIFGSGYKVFLLQKGVIGVFLVACFYYLMLKKAKNKRIATGMLIIYILAFLQRAYPFWETWMYLFLFITSIEQDKIIPRSQKIQ